MQRDQGLLLALKFVRMLAYGQTTMILIPFFLAIGVTDEQVGVFMALTLLGDAIISMFITQYADGWGHRRVLICSSLLIAVAGAVFALSQNFWLLLFAAIFGVISPSGDDVGPFRAIEESALAHITPYSDRAQVYAWQALLGTLGLASGALTGGVLADKIGEHTGNTVLGYQVIFSLYSLLAVVALLICVALSSNIEHFARGWEQSGPADGQNNFDCEHRAVDSAAECSPESPSERQAERVNESEPLLQHGKTDRMVKLSLYLLFGIDSLAYGFMSNSWLVEYMLRTFGEGATKVGGLFGLANIVSAVTSLPSAMLTRAIGPVLTISLTKTGAAIFGGFVPFARSLNVAMGYILMRSLFDTMDVVPRQVFITSVVKPKDRTRVLGIVNVIKTISRGIGPVFTGLLAGRGYLGGCFLIMAGLEGVFALAIAAVYL